MATKQIYFLEGNIGVGKSTLLKELSKEKDKYHIIDEPMDLFCKLENYNPLEMFYKKTMTGFQFSTYIIYIFLDILQNKTVDNKINIVCRNVFSSVFCFAKQSYNIGLMSKIDYDILIQFTKLYSSMLKDYKVTILYLYADPSICYERLRKRNRDEENGVPLEYLESLDKIYNNYINNINTYPVITINASKDIFDVKQDFLKQLL